MKLLTHKIQPCAGFLTPAAPPSAELSSQSRMITPSIDIFPNAIAKSHIISLYAGFLPSGRPSVVVSPKPTYARLSIDTAVSFVTDERVHRFILRWAAYQGIKIGLKHYAELEPEAKYLVNALLLLLLFDKLAQKVIRQAQCSDKAFGLLNWGGIASVLGLSRDTWKVVGLLQTQAITPPAFPPRAAAIIGVLAGLYMLGRAGSIPSIETVIDDHVAPKLSQVCQCILGVQKNKSPTLAS